MGSKNASLLSLDLCLPLLFFYPSAPAISPGQVKVRASPSACAPCPHSYHRGHQCLEKEDWESAVLFFSRALHLDSQLVRGRVWTGMGSLWHTLPLTVTPARTRLSGPLSSLMVTESQTSG